MATSPATAPRIQAGPAEERSAIVRAARTVFAREGWTHTTAAAVAEEAGLEQEAIDHYFRDKEQLLLSVLLDGAATVAAALTAVAGRHLTAVTDLDKDLGALARAWLTPLAAFPEHFALVRHLAAEVTLLPPGVLDVWQTSGPRQAQRELARGLGRLSDAGLLAIADHDHAAGRFVQLVAGPVVQSSFHGALPLPDAETDALVASGVEDFIRLFSPDVTR